MTAAATVGAALFVGLPTPVVILAGLSVALVVLASCLTWGPGVVAHVSGRSRATAGDFVMSGGVTEAVRLANEILRTPATRGLTDQAQRTGRPHSRPEGTAMTLSIGNKVRKMQADGITPVANEGHVLFEVTGVSTMQEKNEAGEYVSSQIVKMKVVE